MYVVNEWDEKTQTFVSARIILTVGRISAVKHLEHIIDALRILMDRALHFYLVLAGEPRNDEDQTYAQELRDRIEAAGLTQRVIWAGPVDRNLLPNYYRNCDLFVSCSRSGPDKAILEAMACEAPVVVTGGFPEWLAEKFPRATAPHGDIQALADAMQREGW